MTTIRAHFDGRVFVPDEPVDLPQGRAVRLQFEEASEEDCAETPLMALYEAFKDLPDDPHAPRDGAAQHDHYLYGTPKRDNP